MQKKMQKVDFCDSQVSWPKWRASMVDDQEALVSDAACDFYHLDADHDGLLRAQEVVPWLGTVDKDSPPGQPPPGYGQSGGQ